MCLLVLPEILADSETDEYHRSFLIRVAPPRALVHGPRTWARDALGLLRGPVRAGGSRILAAACGPGHYHYNPTATSCGGTVP